MKKHDSEALFQSRGADDTKKGRIIGKCLDDRIIVDRYISMKPLWRRYTRLSLLKQAKAWQQGLIPGGCAPSPNGCMEIHSLLNKNPSMTSGFACNYSLADIHTADNMKQGQSKLYVQ
jgi:hypothetical protein